MNEIWKDILGYEGHYKVSNTGKIKSLDRFILREDGKINHIREKIMIGGKTKRGYTFHCLKINKVKSQQYIHRIVATHFIPNPENKPQVNHKDGNKENNNVENLEWNTAKENMLHGYQNGLTKKGEECSCSILNNKDVLEILENKNKLMQKELAKIYGVSASSIKNITTGKRWRHLTNK